VTIKTERIDPPIPTLNLWEAWDDDDPELGVCYGRTEQEVIDRLMERIEEME